MKIIRQGQIPEEKVHQLTCHNCTTLFEFKQGEAETVFDQREGNYMKINCPVCQKTLTKPLVPSNLYWDR